MHVVWQSGVMSSIFGMQLSGTPVYRLSGLREGDSTLSWHTLSFENTDKVTMENSLCLFLIPVDKEH